MNPSFGLDIGSHSIKLVEYSNYKNRKLKTMFSNVHQKNLFTRDGLHLKDETKEVLTEFFFENSFSFRKKNAVVTLPSESYQVFKRSYNIENDQELSDQIHFDIKQVFSEDLHNLHFKFKILGSNDQASSKKDVIVVAAKIGVIENYLDILKEVGVNVAIVDCPQIALLNFAEFCHSLDGYTALIQIGAKYTDIVFTRDGMIEDISTLEFGGDFYTEKVAQELNITAIEAEKAKLHISRTRLDSVSQRRIADILGICNRDLCSSITEKLLAFKNIHSQNKALNLSQIFLCGGAAKSYGLKAEIAYMLSCKVDELNLSNSQKHKSEMLDVYQEELPSFSLAGGLALRRDLDWAS